MSKDHFPFKLYEMLQYAADSGHSSVVSWSNNGRAFTVHQKEVFLEYIVPIFFKQTKFRSFTRQLNLWGFSRFQDIDVWAHPNFILGSIERLELIRRVEVKTGNHQQKRRARKVVRRSSSITRSSTTSVPSSDGGLSSSDNSCFNGGTPRPRVRISIDNDEANQTLCSTTLNSGHQDDGSMTFNQGIININIDKSSSTTTNFFPFLPISRSNGNSTNHSVESCSYPTNAARHYENDDNFTFELSQILGIESRPRPRLHELDSILSWNEVSEDMMDL